MSNKILSIEIGQGLTRVAEIDYKVKNPRIYNIFSIATTPNIVNEGTVTISNLFISELTNAIRRHGISTKKVVFVMNSSRVANRIVQIPFVKANRIADLLAANASDYFPVDMEQYQLIHEVIGTIEDAGEKKIMLSVLAVPKDLLAAYWELAKTCGLTVIGYDYIGNSLKKMMIREIPEEIKATLKIEDNSSILTIIENGIVKLQRTINYGVSDAIDSAINSQLFGYAIDPIEAIEELSRRTCVFSSFDKMEPFTDTENPVNPEEMVDQQKLQALRAEITDNFRILIGSISRILDYYQAQNPDKKIERIYMVGLGSVISGLSRLMTNELSCKVVANQQYNDLTLVKNAANETVHIAEYFTTIGAALEPVSIIAAEKRTQKEIGKGRENAAKSGSLTGAVIICLLGIVGAVAIAFAGRMQLLEAENENKFLTNKIAGLEYVDGVYDDYLQVLANYNWAKGVDDAIYSPNNELVAFIEELEEKMPSEIIVFTLNATRSGVSMNIQVESKSAVADVVSQLRTFSSVYVSHLSTITESVEESGETIVSFDIDLSYVPREVRNLIEE